jgi:hypothetical protein
MTWAKRTLAIYIARVTAHFSSLDATHSHAVSVLMDHAEVRLGLWQIVDGGHQLAVAQCIREARQRAISRSMAVEGLAKRFGIR